MSKLDLYASLGSFGLLLYLYLRRKNRSIYADLPLPPGPRKKLLVGNLLDMPSSPEWVQYHEWCKEFDSDIIHLDVAGTSMVVLDTAEAVLELLERRSSMYSDRARMPMINELMGWDFNFGFMRYGERWRARRRLMHQSFHPTAAKRFDPHITEAAHEVIRRLLVEPHNLMDHLRHMAGQTIMSIAYGIKVLPKNDPYIQTAERGVHPLVAAGVPGAFLVDTIPALKYVPEWMPWAGFKRKAREWRKLAMTMVNMPYETAKRAMADGDFIPSFTSYSLERLDDSGDDFAFQESDIMSTAGTMYAAGTDTTVSATASCVLGLIINPDVLKKAHEEIDRVVGTDRLPTLEDQDSLPYITAIVKETLRWRDVVPIAIPHLLTEDDEYKGYRLPKGTIVVPNAWAMLHNEDVYPEPFKFNPDRFMKDGKLDRSVKDPAHAVFGFGRRVCPGRYMAFSAVWIAVASIIASFDISKAVDENGNIIEPKEDYISALVCMPKPFQYSIKPRSKDAEALIRATENESWS